MAEWLKRPTGQIRRFDSCWMHLERSVQLLLTKLIHIARPDIMYAVQQVCQFMHSPRDTHLQAVKRILRYLILRVRSTLASPLFRHHPLL